MTHLSGELRRKFVSGSIWTVVGRGSSNLVSFLTFALLARLIGPADFGVVALASIFIELTRALALAGIPAALIREREWNDDVASTAFWSNAALSLLLVGVMAVLFAPLAGFFYDIVLGHVLSVLSLCFLIDALRATHEAKLQRDFGFKILARRTFIATIAGGVVGVALAASGFGVWALVANRLAISAIQTITVWLSISWRPHFVYVRQKFLDMFRFGMHLGAAQVLGMLNTRIPELVISAFIGLTAVGYYRLGSRTVSMISDVLILPMQTATLSTFSRLQERGSLAGAYLRLTRGCAAFTFPVFYGMAVIAPDLVLLCFGERWQPSGATMTVLAVFGGAASLGNFFQPVLAAAGKSHLVSLYSLSSALANLVVVIATVHFGILAVAIGFTLRAYAGIPFGLVLLKRAIGVPPIEVLKRLAPAFTAATIMALGLAVFRWYFLENLDPLWRVCALVPAGAIIYPAFLFLFHRRYLRSLWADLLPDVPIWRLRWGG